MTLLSPLPHYRMKRRNLRSAQYAGLPDRACVQCGARYPLHRDFFKFNKAWFSHTCYKCRSMRDSITRRQPENRRKATERSRIWRANNRERIREIQRRCHHRRKFARPAKPARRTKWEQIRDLLRANPGWLSLSGRQINDLLPDNLKSCHMTIARAVNTVLREK